MTSRKIAIVGAGYMAREHARAFAALDGVTIAGVCGRTKTRAKELADEYGTNAYDSIEALYRHTEADAVVVAVNELSAFEVCVAVFKHPWLCLLEKPVGVDLRQALELQELARRAGTRAYVALNRRSYGSTRRALEAICADPGPRLISVLDQQDMDAARQGGQPEAVVRNYMFANSIHLIDYFNVFGRGEVMDLDVKQPWDPKQPGYVVATIRFASGDLGVYQAVWNGPGPWSVAVTNRSARVEMRPLEKTTLQRRGQRSTEGFPDDPYDMDFKPGLKYQAEQVIAALAGQSVRLASLDEATRSMMLCARIYGLGLPDAR